MSNNPFETPSGSDGENAVDPSQNVNPFASEVPQPPAPANAPAPSELDEIRNLVKQQAAMIASLNERVIRSEAELAKAYQTVINSGGQASILSSDLALENFASHLGLAIVKATNPSAVIPTTTEPPDPNDYLIEPDIFYAYRTYHLIADDVRQGVTVRVPGNTPILQFKNVAYHRQESGALAVCRYECHSKKVSKWLREHSKFNVEFFAQGQTPIFAQGNSDYSTELASRVAMMSKWPPGQIAAECVRLGIPTSENTEKMVAAAAAKETDELFMKHPNGLYERKSDYNARLGMEVTAEKLLVQKKEIQGE